ncbi:unnamed protein product [Rotaria sp. Silwood1]|nr:unnamed protein product [Rotaria sp. Silwood1]CAF4725205.1 unnamed protein product [Rotaria sp. Silwood1]
MVHNIHQQKCYPIDNLTDQSSKSCLNNKRLCPVAHDDSQSIVHCINDSDHRQQRPPPPLMSNSTMINSPARSKRGSPSSDPDEDDFQIITRQKKKKQIDLFNRQRLHHQQNLSVTPNKSPSNTNRFISSRTITNSNNINNQRGPPDQQNVTTAAARYATSRFPFPPYIIRFKSNQVTLDKFKEDVVNHFKYMHQVDIEILNCRSSKVKCVDDDMDILLYVKDSISFASLHDETKWPLKIAGEDYMFPSRPSIPPQLSVIIKNVNVRIDFEEFTNDVKSMIPEVINVIRMKNKFGNIIHMVKLELSSVSARQDLLDAKKLMINYISYEITEFLSPAQVLICSKCSGIGHFRKQCSEQDETCKNCAQAFPDLKSHQCSASPVCKHCQGNHLSNSMKCPVIKSFRAELTRKLLSSDTNPTAVTPNNNNNNYCFNPLNFPPLPSTQAQLNNPMMSKLDDLIVKINDVKDHLASITLKHDKFEKFMVEKAKQDTHVSQQIDTLSANDQEFKKDLLNHHMLLQRHENFFTKLFIPMLEEVFSWMALQNQDKKGNTLDADLKCRLECYVVQMRKTREGKHRFN